MREPRSAAWLTLVEVLIVVALIALLIGAVLFGSGMLAVESNARARRR